jgi:hypothetical protein
MQNIKVSVYDGKHHPVDSKEVAFITAGKRAFVDAVQKASTGAAGAVRFGMEISGAGRHDRRHLVGPLGPARPHPGHRHAAGATRPW